MKIKPAKINSKGAVKAACTIGIRSDGHSAENPHDQNRQEHGLPLV